MITLKKDLESVTSILYETFKIIPFKRDYDRSFGEIANILKHYGLNEDPRNLRLRFTLFMQEFFDSIPENQWSLKNAKFIKESEEFAIIKIKEWILEQVT